MVRLHHRKPGSRVRGSQQTPGPEGLGNPGVAHGDGRAATTATVHEVGMCLDGGAVIISSAAALARPCAEAAPQYFPAGPAATAAH